MTVATEPVEFDPFSDDFFQHPYEIYKRLRDEAPVYYNEKYDFYALTRHEDVTAAFRDYETSPRLAVSTSPWSSRASRSPHRW